MSACDWFPRPEGINPHNFDVCNTHGGKAYRDWCMLLRHKGVFIGFRNHNWVVYISSDPNAKWIRGCQDSRLEGSPLPRSDEATFVQYHDLPADIRIEVKQQVAEAIRIAKGMIQQTKEEESRKMKRQRKEKERRFRESVINPWREYISGRQ